MASVAPVESCNLQNCPGVTCSGPCQKTFHRQSSAGWLWFCAECLPDVVQQNENLAMEHAVPAEVWELIFVNLNPRQLLRVRGTCRYWRTIVDGSMKLLDRLPVYFPAQVTMDERYVPANLFPTATRARWSSKCWSQITSMTAWWQQFAPRLTQLDLGVCTVLFPVLLDMLRHTPHLRKLDAGQVQCEPSSKYSADFQLNKMSHLSVCCKFRCDGTSASVLDTFVLMFPNLKSFSSNYGMEYVNEIDCQVVAAFIAKYQRTLTELVLLVKSNAETDRMFSTIGQLEHLKLTQLAIDKAPEDNVLLEFCRLQSNIEDLTFTANRSDEVLDEIGQLCRLKRFSGAFFQNESNIAGLQRRIPSFLNKMTKLEYLHLKPYNSHGLTVDFGCMANAHIAEINLFDIAPVKNSLQRYFQLAQKLTCVNLDDCQFLNWIELIDTLRAVELLKNLTLKVRVQKSRSPTSVQGGCFDHLESLKLYDVPGPVRKHILPKCPALRELTVVRWNMDAFRLEHEMPLLEKLSLNRIKLSAQGALDILLCCNRQLQELELVGVQMQNAGKLLFEREFGPRMIVR